MLVPGTVSDRRHPWLTTSPSTRSHTHLPRRPTRPKRRFRVMPLRRGRRGAARVRHVRGALRLTLVFLVPGAVSIASLPFRDYTFAYVSLVTVPFVLGLLATLLTDSRDPLKTQLIRAWRC